MTADTETLRARRYLLGQASEEERSAVEQEYFHGEEALEQMLSAEDELIAAFLTDRLEPAERLLFERDYLASARHRRRVAIVRALRASSAAPAARPAPAFPRWLSVAAAVLLLAGSLSWLVNFVWERPDSDARGPAVSTAPAPPALPTPPAAPRVFAVSISPAAVRSLSEPQTVMVPAGADIVAVTLAGERERQAFVTSRATIRTVAGVEIWQGPASAATSGPGGAVARVDIPASRLIPDDYIITLLGSDAAGVEHERFRYFLRVGSR